MSSDAPVCAVVPSLRGVALREAVNISCRVDADPPDVDFYWTFNNSVRREQTELLQSNRLAATVIMRYRSAAAAVNVVNRKTVEVGSRCRCSSLCYR